MEANTSLCRGSDVQNRLSKKKKRKKKKKYPASWIWKSVVWVFYCSFLFCAVGFLLQFHNVFFSSSAQVILSQLLRIFNNPFASLLSPHGDLIEFHNLSNIAPDENVLWPRWHIGLHLKGFRAADQFFFLSGSESKTTKSTFDSCWKLDEHLSFGNIPLSYWHSGASYQRHSRKTSDTESKGGKKKSTF